MKDKAPVIILSFVIQFYLDLPNRQQRQQCQILLPRMLDRT